MLAWNRSNNIPAFPQSNHISFITSPIGWVKRTRVDHSMKHERHGMVDWYVIRNVLLAQKWTRVTGMVDQGCCTMAWMPLSVKWQSTTYTKILPHVHDNITSHLGLTGLFQLIPRNQHVLYFCYSKTMFKYKIKKLSASTQYYTPGTYRMYILYIL